ncbi:MAG: DUF1566 domain-containing protein [Spirochaetes bacterium]|nr:DUF1566 domain-containing protein [Spirochaetota bacterium]
MRVRKAKYTIAIALSLCTTMGIASRLYEEGTGELAGTVLDKATGLRWTKCSMKAGGVMDDSSDCSGPAAEYTWEQAVTVCHNLNYKGITSWRLPNIRELLSIVTYYKIIDPVFDSLKVSLIQISYFPNIPRGSESGFLHSHYWSSSTYRNDSKRAWSFDFLWGASPGRWKTQTAFVRCVSGPEK